MTLRSSVPSELRIGVAAFGTDGARSGIGSYLRQWLDAVEPQAQHARFDVLAPASEMNELVPAALACRRVAKPDALRSPFRGVLWHQAALPLEARRANWDVAFLPAANRRLPAWMPCPTVGTVHDMSMAKVASKYDRTHSAYFHTVLPALIRRLDRVVTVSECSKRDIVEIAGVDPGRIHVVPHGVNAARFQPRDDAASAIWRSSRGLEAPYLLYVARLEHPGKNHVALIRAFERMKARTRSPIELVLAGASWNGADQIFEAARRSACAGTIRFTGFTPEDGLPALYRGALGYVFPSLYEGFGMPLLEAMSSGVPVACSNVSSLPEVAGEAALYFDPQDETSMADALERLVMDPAGRVDLRNRGFARAAQFTWKESVRRTFDVFREATRGSVREAA